MNVVQDDVIAALRHHAQVRPLAAALDDGVRLMSYARLDEATSQCASTLRAVGALRVAIYADNGIGWALADLALLRADAVSVPLPLFFSDAQFTHAFSSAGIDHVLVDRRLSLPQALNAADLEPVHLDGIACEFLQLYRLRAAPESASALPEGTRKITYTSGTTGAPKGVCLGVAQQQAVASALAEASRATSASHHLAVLPLATLLENIGGLYAPLLVGATAHLPALSEVGMLGASGFDVTRLLAQMQRTRASSLILVPQLLQALVVAIEHGAAIAATLRFVAVGGARVSPKLIERSRNAGLPVFEGYGLSECASVVALNTPQYSRVGSVGRTLSHVRVELGTDGEVLVRGNGFLGYVGETPRDPDTLIATGDIGAFNDDGTLSLSGRKKSIFVTAFGRNVSPEWVESELCLQPAIAQAAVFGEARPFNVAVIVARTPVSAEVDAAIAAVNRGLPDYARIGRWVSAHAPFSMTNGQLTANGRLRREALAAAYADVLNSFYEEVEEVAS